ncbi:hypothetical protein Chor_012943 [Crotalus horridus]
MEGLSASAAFWDHLRQLCLDQFPCGVGSWNKSRFPPRLPLRLHGLPALRLATLPRRNGLLSPNEETAEALTEFLRCPDSPWALPPDCSPPEQQLRELAVQHPQIVRTSFVCSYFRSLRIVNKGVTEIDGGLLKFPNLEELILTANHISTIPAANLPPGLKLDCSIWVSATTASSVPRRNNIWQLLSEALLSDVKLIVAIGKMRGLPNPLNPEELEGSPDSPIVTHSYYVTYEFATGEEKGEKAASKVGHRGALTAGDVASSPLVAVDGETTEPLSSQPSPKLDLQPEPRANMHSTAKKGWAEAIDCDYRKEHLTQDLGALKAYLLAGTTISVVEEKSNETHLFQVVSWPVVLTPEEKTSKKGKGKGEKGKADSGKADKGKEKGKEKDTGKLRSDPPIVRTLGSLHVSLEKLLAGASLLETTCDFGVQITERSVSLPSPKDKESKKGAKKDAKAKSGIDIAISRKTPPPPTPSPTRGKGRKKDSPEGPDSQLSQPVPLTVEFQMQHIKWESASPILKMQEASE